MIAELLGIPLEDGDRLYDEPTTNSGVPGDHNPCVTDAAIEMFSDASELAARKRTQPLDDIARSPPHAEIDGQRSPTWSRSCSSCR